MKLTLLQTGDVPAPLRQTFGPYAKMFETMFDQTGRAFSYDVIKVSEGEPLPKPGEVEAVVLPGSAAGVYEDHAWLAPLREFIRQSYAARIPMLGICFGHQIMADALGGAVRKSDKGWGLGRHRYETRHRPSFMQTAPASFAVACSHQDQVIEPPQEGEVILSSDFTPNAGLAYRNGAALSFQAHPEFEDDYALALAELRRGSAPDRVVDKAVSSLTTPSDSRAMASYIAAFFSGR